MDSKLLKMELIEMVAKQVREDLERDALRTIRQRDAEKGKAILDRIEGIERFMGALHQACQHGFYKQAGLVTEEKSSVLRAHSRVQVISKKKRAG
jgi:hypothetical protein